MRIDYLQISNVMSFKYVEDISQAEKINFDSGLNIIIGENGAGKSTALEVLNFIFKRVIFRQYNVNQDFLSRHNQISQDERRQIVTPVNQQSFGGFRLDANWSTEGKDRRIRIAIRLDEIDVQNIENIRQHTALISSTMLRFSNHAIPNDGEYDLIYTVDIYLNNQTGRFEITFPSGSDNFGFTYLSQYHFFKELLSLNNLLDSKNPVPPLFESFTFISSYRNYHNFQPSVSLRDAHPTQQIQQIKAQDYNRSLNDSDKNEPPIFGLVRLQVAERHFDLMDQNKTLEERENEANNIPFMHSINARLALVNLRCRIRLIDKRTWQYQFEFTDIRRDKLITDINSLSAGQKAIVHLVFGAYGRGDLKGGLVIIDEPEIHLHYQFQHEYLQVINDLKREQGCQYVLVTHSESLINSNTISSVRRFSLDNHGYTNVHSPVLRAEQKTLIKILDNSRSTYAFFAKKVMLVEGETDRYFYRAIIQELHPHHEQEIAVLNIGGKPEYKKWKELFSAFGLSVSFVGDFDCVIDFGYPGQQSTKLRTAAAVSAFKASHTDWEQKIDDQYLHDIFILKEGDLEAYTGVAKDLTKVIDFCRTELARFLTDTTSTKGHEVRSLVQKIAT